MVDLPQRSDFFFFLPPHGQHAGTSTPVTDGDGGEDEDKIKME